MGNPLHTLQMLRLLVSRGNIHHDREGQHNWKWKDADIQETMKTASSVEELVRQKLALLPQHTQQILQHAACMGDDIDIIALATVSDGTLIPEIDSSLAIAATAGHVDLDLSSGRYRFVHDSVVKQCCR
jgi:predicted ATPase